MQLSFVTVLALVSLAVAIPNGVPPPPPPPPPTTTPHPPPTTTTPAPPPPTTTIPASQCNTGPVQCCNSTQDAKSPSLSAIYALLGLNVQDITGLVGLTCDPISVIGVGGNSCSAQPVCCSNNTFKGLIAIGCTPVNLNL